MGKLNAELVSKSKLSKDKRGSIFEDLYRDAVESLQTTTLNRSPLHMVLADRLIADVAFEIALTTASEQAEHVAEGRAEKGDVPSISKVTYEQVEKIGACCSEEEGLYGLLDEEVIADWKSVLHEEIQRTSQQALDAYAEQSDSF